MAPNKRCTHYECRCRRAAELAAMGLTFKAIEIWTRIPIQLVQCWQSDEKEPMESYPTGKD